MLNHQGTKTIETGRLILRKFRESDAEPMFANWANDPLVTAYMTWNAHPNIEVTKQIIAEWMTVQDDPKTYHWAIELKELGQVIGSVGAFHFGEITRCATLGYCIGRNWWGQGFMPEAIAALMQYLFDTVGLVRIGAVHHVDNPKSGRVMQKCGMRHVGAVRKYSVGGDGELHDCEMYEIIDTDPR